MSAPAGVYARRNAGHREAAEERWVSARSARQRLAVAYDTFRAATALLAKRRTPAGVPQDVHRAAADRLVEAEAVRLMNLARLINRGEVRHTTPGKG